MYLEHLQLKSQPFAERAQPVLHDVSASSASTYGMPGI